MIDITTPAGPAPRDLLVEVLAEVTAAALDGNDRCVRPPQLHDAVGCASSAQQLDDVDDLDRELCNVAQAAIASVVRIRAAAA